MAAVVRARFCRRVRRVRGVVTGARVLSGACGADFAIEWDFILWVGQSAVDFCEMECFDWRIA